MNERKRVALRGRLRGWGGAIGLTLVIVATIVALTILGVLSTH